MPKVREKIRFHAGGLVCKKEHRFDISSKGYVNMLQASKPLKGYDQTFFACRNRFMRGGYYAHVGEEVLAQVQKYCAEAYSDGAVSGSGEGTGPVIVDAGCGEGYYSRLIAREFPEAQVLAFDLATDAIKVAAKSDLPVKWMVADITNIPMKDGMADCILDVFTPANYKEFGRVLADDGIVIKVIPGANHMGQLREAASELLRNKEYSNEEVMDYFLEHFDLVDHMLVSATKPIGAEDLADLVRMTPLLFDVDKNKLNLDAVKEITVEAEVLVGKKRG